MKIGDVVVYKHVDYEDGGPLMTVVQTYEGHDGDYAEVAWFDLAMHLQQTSVPVKALTVKDNQ